MQRVGGLIVGVAVLGLGACAGCTAPARTGAVAKQVFTTTDASQSDLLWEASQNVLRENRFVLNRVDRRAGVISARPVTSQHFFELWRHDVDTFYDQWEATLHTVQRWATIEIDFDAEAGTSELTVRVHRQLFATPERQCNNSVAAFRVFGNELPDAQTGRRLTAADSYWVDDGRDLKMERYLLEKIAVRAALSTNSPDRPQFR